MPHSPAYTSPVRASLVALYLQLVTHSGVQYCVTSLCVFQKVLQIIIGKKKSCIIIVYRCESWLAGPYLIFIYGIFLAKEIHLFPLHDF